MAYIFQKGLYILFHRIQVWYSFLSHVSSPFETFKLLPMLLRIQSQSLQDLTPCWYHFHHSTSSFLFLKHADYTQPQVFALAIPSAWSVCHLLVGLDSKSHYLPLQHLFMVYCSSSAVPTRARLNSMRAGALFHSLLYSQSLDQSLACGM